MENAVFYLIVAIWTFAGYKKGAAGAGYTFTAAGIASYFSVWLLPFSSKTLEYIPAEYSGYAFSAILLLSFFVIFFAVRAGIEKFLDAYPALDSDITLSEMPPVNSMLGAVYGVCSGFAVTAFFVFLLTFAPIEIPYVTNEKFAEFADGKFFLVSRVVNHASSDEWNTKQQEYVKYLADKFRKCNLDKAAEDTPAPVPESKEKVAESAKVDPGSQVPHVDTGVPAQSSDTPGEPTAAQKFASKAVQAAVENQKRAEQVNFTEKKEQHSRAVHGVEMTEEQKNKLAEQGAGVLNNMLNTGSADALQTHNTASPAAADGKGAAVQYTIPGTAVKKPSENAPGVDGVTFSLVLPVLKEDGSNSEFTRVVKLGIRLPEDGKVPRIIEIDAPHSVLNDRKQVIYRKVRVDMSQVTYAQVRNLKPQLDTKYVVVKDK